MNITPEQLAAFSAIADELRRLALTESQIGSPATYQLKQMDRALPELAMRIEVLCATIESQSNDLDLQARF